MVRVYDVAFVLWVVAWLAVGAASIYQAQQLRQLSDAAIAAGGALDETADALTELRDLPLVGAGLGEIEDRVRTAAARASDGGREAERDIRNFSIMLGLTVALVPILPLLAVYLPLRRAWARERRSIREGLRRGDRVLDEYLARRALARLPYEEVRGLGGGSDPVREATRALADAELGHLGLERPADTR
jgi:hypothetical protein